MKKIIKKRITKGFLLFLFTFLCVGVHAQYDEYGSSGGCDPDNISATEKSGPFDSNGDNAYGIHKESYEVRYVNYTYTAASGWLQEVVLKKHTEYTCKKQNTGPLSWNPYATVTNTYVGSEGNGVKPPCKLTAAICAPYVLKDCACVEKTVEKPCQGNPVKSPEIAPQKNSGINGGRFGKTRSGGTQYHNGLDIKNAYGAPVYAMFDGTASLAGDANGKAGYISYQTATVNGKSISVQYFHMQNAGRVSGNVKAGDLIGYQGDSGNLANAISSGSSASHVHIKIKDSNGKTVNPEDYLATKFNSTTGKATNVCK